MKHELLFEFLMHVGVKDMALSWFKNYLENRSSHVIINETKSMRRLFKEVCHTGVFWDQSYFLFIRQNFHGF